VMVKKKNNSKRARLPLLIPFFGLSEICLS